MTGGNDLFETIPDPEEECGFSWSDPDLDVMPEQPETCVYRNPRGQLVIRQRREVFEDDPYLYFEPDRVPRLIAMIRKVME